MMTDSSAKKSIDIDVALIDSSDTRESTNISRIKKLNSIKLFEASKEVMIEHDRDIYFLRVTRQNKLILTK